MNYFPFDFVAHLARIPLPARQMNVPHDHMASNHRCGVMEMRSGLDLTAW